MCGLANSLPACSGPNDEDERSWAINMLRLAKRVKTKMLQASTSEVYGDPAVHPQNEEYWGNVNPIGPRSCMNEAKGLRRHTVSSITHDSTAPWNEVRSLASYKPRTSACPRWIPSLRDGELVAHPILWPVGTILVGFDQQVRGSRCKIFAARAGGRTRAP